MLTEKEKSFIENRRKISRIMPPFLMMLMAVWLVIYLLMFVSFPEITRFGAEYECETAKFVPVFFNLFMVVLLVLTVSYFAYLSVEKEYLKIIKKIEAPPKEGEDG
ncbi:hypothetical protein [Persephonella sp.]